LKGGVSQGYECAAKLICRTADSQAGFLAIGGVLLADELIAYFRSRECQISGADPFRLCRENRRHNSPLTCRRSCRIAGGSCVDKLVALVGWFRAPWRSMPKASVAGLGDGSIAAQGSGFEPSENHLGIAGSRRKIRHPTFVMMCAEPREAVACEPLHGLCRTRGILPAMLCDVPGDRPFIP
jgi:hypothetical protein